MRPKKKGTQLEKKVNTVRTRVRQTRWLGHKLQEDIALRVRQVLTQQLHNPERKHLPKLCLHGASRVLGMPLFMRLYCNRRMMHSAAAISFRKLKVAGERRRQRFLKCLCILRDLHVCGELVISNTYLTDS